MEPDYYRRLRVSRHATRREIEAAYLLAISSKPVTWWERLCWALADRTPERLTRAFETLSDPAQRERYDKYLADRA